MQAARETEASTLSWLEEPLPGSLEPELAALYQNPFSTLSFVRLFNPGVAPMALVVRRAGEVQHILLARRTGHRVEVLNGAVPFSEADLALFLEAIFDRYPAVDLIAFHPFQAPPIRLSFPHQLGVVEEDIVVTLSPTVAEYRKRLSSKSRKTIDHKLVLLKRDHPEYCFRATPGPELEEATIREVLRLQRARMAVHGRKSGIDDAYEDRIVALARTCGLVGIVTIQGRIAAGAITYSVGSQCFMHVIAHDSEYNHLSLGRLCMYLMICHCIERGDKEFHFLWGQHGFKYQFLGVNRELVALTVYRSRMARLIHPLAYAQAALRIGRHRMKGWATDVRGRLGGAPRLLVRKGARVAGSVDE
jgi:CelD/BcsL family acetyltransferase involved in cellulose biosynthesis